MPRIIQVATSTKIIGSAFLAACNGRDNSNAGDSRTDSIGDIAMKEQLQSRYLAFRFARHNQSRQSLQRPPELVSSYSPFDSQVPISTGQKTKRAADQCTLGKGPPLATLSSWRSDGGFLRYLGWQDESLSSGVRSPAGAAAMPFRSG